MYFEYMNYKDRHWISIRIGEFVSHELIKNLSVAEINQIDRIASAHRWYNAEDHWKKERINDILKQCEIDKDTFYLDVAKWIDERIPKAYKKNFLQDADHGPANQIIKLKPDGTTEYGLIYHYSENISYTRKNSSYLENYNRATDKQLEYLKKLACKHNYVNLDIGFSKNEASQFIDYFKNLAYMEEPPTFHKYYVKF